MENSTKQKVLNYSRMAKISTYDLAATFGEGRIGRKKKRLVGERGKYHLDTQAWEAGEVAYQCLKQLYPNGITTVEFTQLASDFYLLVCNEVYPKILILAEEGKLDIQPNGVKGLKKAWSEYGFCERVIFAFDFIEGLIDIGANFDNSLNTVLPLVLLQRLDDAVIAEFCDGSGLPSLMLEIASLRDRLQPPKHVNRTIKKLQSKVDTFTQARRNGADKIHVENRSMKAEVFKWLDANMSNKKMDVAAAEIAGKIVPLTFRTVRGWVSEWKKLKSVNDAK